MTEKLQKNPERPRCSDRDVSLVDRLGSQLRRRRDTDQDAEAEEMKKIIWRIRQVDDETLMFEAHQFNIPERDEPEFNRRMHERGFDILSDQRQVA